MSLDLYIISSKPIKKTGTGVYVRDSGMTKELKTIEEVQKWFPGRDIKDIKVVEYETDTVWEKNITHNLGIMASHIPVSDNYTLYDLLWRPNDHGFHKVNEEYINYIEEGLNFLNSHEEDLKIYNPENGWGSYENLLEFVYSLIDELKKLDLSKDTYTLYASI